MTQFTAASAIALVWDGIVVMPEKSNRRACPRPSPDQNSRAQRPRHPGAAVSCTTAARPAVLTSPGCEAPAVKRRCAPADARTGQASLLVRERHFRTFLPPATETWMGSRPNAVLNFPESTP
jgi:hypothetical protein